MQDGHAPRTVAIAVLRKPAYGILKDVNFKRAKKNLMRKSLPIITLDKTLSKHQVLFLHSTVLLQFL